MPDHINPIHPSKRYSGYQQANTISLFLLKRTLILLLLTVHYLGFAQTENSTDSLTFVKYEFDNGQISSEGYLRNGNPDGYWKSYYRTGHLKSEGNRENFMLSGPWKFYDEDGQIQSVIRYVAGMKEGTREYWAPDSVLKREVPYVADEINGTSTYYYPNRDIKKLIPFVNNREEGTGYEFDTTGTVTTILTYRSGVLTKEQEINRYDRFGLKKGTWVEFFNDMNVRIEGTYKDDLKHGFWKYYKRNGDLIRIEKWVMGVLQEDEDNTTSKIDLVRTVDPNTGKITAIGGYQNGQKNGVHRQFDEDGNIISAELWQNDILLAEGLYDNQGRKQGIWKYYWPDGTLKATGKYINDSKDGEWKYFFEDGTLEQVGKYMFDQLDGVWRWYFKDGELRLEQNFFEGLADGDVVEYNDSNEVIVQGQYLDGLKTGIWKYSSHGVLETGEYVQGEREGRWTITWLDSGQLREEGDYSNGKKEGLHVTYYNNGQIARRGQYSNGLKEGVWEQFATNGARIVTITYSAGEEIKYNRTELDNGRR